MSKEKQIEEMAHDLCGRCQDGICVVDGKPCNLDLDCTCQINATTLYNAGYRKQSDGEWELHGNDDDLGSSFFCSRCGWNIDEDEFYQSQTNDYKMYKFCPNCGAKNERR